jgi:ankyrin repeat protein
MVNTAAYYAGNNYSEETLRLLAAKGARLDITNKQGESPLMYHIYREYTTEGVAFILDWEEQNNPGFSAQFENRKDYLTPILDRLLYRVSSRYSLYVDFSVDYYTLIDKLIEDGASLNALNKDGQTVLYNATLNRNFEQVNYLLGKGADPNRQNSSGETALMAVCFQIGQDPDMKSIQETISLLMDFGADPNLQGLEGDTVML